MGRPPQYHFLVLVLQTPGLQWQTEDEWQISDALKDAGKDCGYELSIINPDNPIEKPVTLKYQVSRKVSCISTLK